MDPRVRELVLTFMDEEFGNAGSRTHEHGARAKRAVEHARDQVAAVVGAQRDEVIFTSGATESNNLAILGLRTAGESSGRRHIVSTAIEHKAVLEPLAHLGQFGFEIEIVHPTRGGWVDPGDVLNRVREDTLLVSVMGANNETGVIQPIEEVAAALHEHAAYFHVDAAQVFGKEPGTLRNERIDLISISGHKIYAPKGVGALVARRRGFSRAPLEPLMFGGGQERGLRPGTLPVHLIAGLGLAAELAIKDAAHRRARCLAIRDTALEALMRLDPTLNGDQHRSQAHVLNVSLPGLDSEAAMVALKGVASVANGSACTSASYSPSHVLSSMGLERSLIDAALRFSWCHLTPDPDWSTIVDRLSGVR